MCEIRYNSTTTYYRNLLDYLRQWLITIEQLNNETDAKKLAPRLNVNKTIVKKI